jgi:hypothetical protein
VARDTRLLAEKWAPWVAGAVLVAGVASYAAVHFTGSDAPPHEKSKLLPVERRVALEFVHSAVARKNLARAWEISAPELREGTTREEWLSGTLRVVPYPVAKAHVVLHTVSSFTDVARLTVTFVPNAGTDAEQQTFLLDLRNVDGQWLVSAWQPSEAIRPHEGG